MFDLFTYSIYLFLLGFILLLTFKASSTGTISLNKINLTQNVKISFYHILALIAISFVVGFRNGVGVDWKGYKDLFEDISANIPSYKVEFGYYIINKWVAMIGGSAEIMFFIVALISWFFIFKSVPKILLPLTLFFLYADEVFFWSMNGVRQFVALSIFLYSIRFIINRTLIKYLFFIIIAILFHTSAVLLLPLYFIPFQKLYNQKFWFIAFIISSFFANSQVLVDGLRKIIFYGANQFGLLSYYLGFFDRGQYIAGTLILGLGFIFKFLINLFIIFFSKEVVKQNPQTKIYFVLFFISTIIFNLFYMYQPIGRLNTYFAVLRCIVLALIIYHLSRKRKYQLLAISVIMYYFILFLSTIYNSSNLCSPYGFSF